MTESKVNGYPWSAEMPSWLVWTGPAKDWEVTLGDHDSHFIPGASGDEQQAITVSAGPHAGARWFIVENPRELAAALLAAADAAEGDCWRCAQQHEDEKCGRHARPVAALTDSEPF